MKGYKKIALLMRLILLSIFISALIRVFIFNFYRVTSNSMSPNIISGDLILTNKLIYGARVFINTTSHNQRRLIRLPRFSGVNRGDIVLFNFPFKNYHSEWDTVCMNSNIVLVKNCLAQPGDIISMKTGVYYINGSTATYSPGPQIDNLFLSADSISYESKEAYENLLNPVLTFNSFYIPKRGTTIPLNYNSLKLYLRQIVYETNAIITFEDSTVFFNNKLVNKYTFKYNWYFMAGNDLTNSQDSRQFGLVPETFIIGKAAMIISSRDMKSKKIRWNRFFKKT